MWWRRTQFRWLPKRSKVRELSRWPCCYIKRLPKMENWERHCDPQIYRKDFIRRWSQTFTTLFRPINRFICNCNTDPFSIFKTSSTLGQKIRLPIDFKTEIEYLRYILNYCLTRLDTLDEITSENPVPWMKHPLRHKLLHKKMKPQSRVLSPLYNLHLQMMMKMKSKCLQWATKDLSMRIVLKRTPLVLFQQKRLPLVPQLVGSLAPVCQKGGEGEIYLRSITSLPTLPSLEDGGPVGEISLPHGHPVSRKQHRWGIREFCSRW